MKKILFLIIIALQLVETKAQWNAIEVLHLKPEYSFSEYVSDIYVHNESVYTLNSNSWDIHPHYIFKSDDLGKNWTYINFPGSTINFKSSNTGELYALGNPFFFYPQYSISHSRDDGETWNLLYDNLEISTEDSIDVYNFRKFQYVKSYSIIDSTFITISDSTYGKNSLWDTTDIGGIYKSINNAKTWVEFDSVFNKKRLKVSEIFSYDKYFILLTNEGELYHSHKDSLKWSSQKVEIFNDLDIHNLLINKSGRVYALNDKVIHYVDISIDKGEVSITNLEELNLVDLVESESAYIETSTLSGNNLIISVADSVNESKVLELDLKFELKNLTQGLTSYNYKSRFHSLKASESILAGRRYNSFKSGSYNEETQSWSSDTDYIYILETSTILSDENHIEGVKSFTLSQNYPNPFNPNTNISFGLPQSSLVQLKVYNLLGQEVASLVDERRNAGNHTVNFDASQLSSGVYIYRLITGSQSITKKMMLIK